MECEDMMSELIDSEAQLAVGLDTCIIGVGRQCGEATRAIYSEDKIIALLVKRDGMSLEDAREFYEFNILGSYIENGPIYMEVLDHPDTALTDREAVLQSEIRSLSKEINALHAKHNRLVDSF